MAKKKKSPKKRRNVPRSSEMNKRRNEGGGGSGNPVTVSTRGQFERYLDGDLPVIVDFWATWCVPCQAMAPIFKKVGKEFEGKAHFIKIDTETLSSVSTELGIRSIPTLLVFHGDEVIDSNIGLTSEAALRKMTQRAIDKVNGVTLGSKVKRLFGMKGKGGDEAQAAE